MATRDARVDGDSGMDVQASERDGSVPARRRLLAAGLACASLGVVPGCMTVAGPPPSVDAFVPRRVLRGDRSVAYRVFVPRRRGAAPVPVVMFLHGSGERGDDNVAQTRSGLGPWLARTPDFPAIAVFPQAPLERNWSGDVAADAMAALEDATRDFGGDPARTCLTGMSRGGYGVWELALLHPARFAALVPVCGGLENPPNYDDLFVAPLRAAADPYAALARQLHAVPAWLFHGARDDLVPPENSRRIVAALRAAGGTPRYTEFPDANHNSWDPAYAMPELWTWVFAQRLA